MQKVEFKGDAAGVIWISGFSAAGKTTVGRKVVAELRNQGFPAIFLDGDHLRSIFGSRWGYERAERVELARIYFRLCSNLAAQGNIVVISAVAMYDEIRTWIREYIPGVLEVYLNVPEPERERRDQSLKKVYSKMGNLADLYDLPDASVLSVDNFGDATPDTVAKRVIDRYFERGAASVGFGRTDHWRDYYASTSAPESPSPFAQWVSEQIDGPVRLLEIGCGNGRDSRHFSGRGHAVTAIDPSEAAIVECRKRAGPNPGRYLHGTLPTLADSLEGPFDVLYSRFVIHAMPLIEEVALLDSAAKVVRPGGHFHIECRSINDAMAYKGEVISPTERIFGHYRRFIVREELEARLESAGFEVVSSLESTGLAPHGDEDPMVIRVIARRR